MDVVSSKPFKSNCSKNTCGGLRKYLPSPALIKNEAQFQRAKDRVKPEIVWAYSKDHMDEVEGIC